MRFLIFIFTFLFSVLIKAQFISPGILLSKGDSCKNRYEYENAIKYYEKITNTKVKSVYLNRCFKLASCYKEIGEFEKADSIYTSLLKRDIALRHKVSTKINLANVFNLTGRYAEAIELIQSISSPFDSIQCAITLANSYLYQSKDKKALTLYNQAMSACKSEDSLYMVACNGKGFLMLQKHKYVEAIECFQKAVNYYPANHPRRYQAMGNLALAEGLNHNTNVALRWINEALYWQEQHLGKQHFDYIKCLNKKGQILMAVDMKEEAVNCFSDYFSLERENIVRYFSTMTEKERLAYWKSRRVDIAQCYTLEQSSPTLLYNVAIFSKTITLLANCNFRKFVEKNAQKHDLYNELEALRRRQKNTSDKTIFMNLERKAESIEKQLLSGCGMYASFKRNMDVSLDNVRSKLKNRNDVAIEFIKYTKSDTVRYAAVILNADGTTIFCSLFKESDFLSQIIKGTSETTGDALEGNSYHTIDKMYRDKSIADKIWLPIVLHLPKKGKIYFAPDGIFQKLAIEYICDSLMGERTKKDIYRLSSTRSILNKNEKINGKILLIGDINYNCIELMGRESFPDRRTANLLRRENMPPANGSPYPELTGSAIEIDSIALRINRREACKLSGKEATEDTLKRIAGNYNLIHIATHGYTYTHESYPKENGELSADLSMYRSGILLAGANTASSDTIKNKEDGILSANEISELHLGKTNLIVLSACQTALGSIEDEGPIGLVRGLKKAGVQQMVASLWEVSDDATQKLMTAFYDGIAKGLNAHDALIDAQNSIRKIEKKSNKPLHFSQKTKRYEKESSERNPSITHPYDRPSLWAPFITIDSFK